MKTVQRKDIIKDIHRRTNGILTLKEVELVVSLYEDSIADFISEAYKVQLSGLFTLEPAIQSARQGNHIVTGERINIPEKPTVKFRQGRAIKRALEQLTIEDIKVAKTMPAASPQNIDKRAETRDNFAKRKSTTNVIDAMNKAVNKPDK